MGATGTDLTLSPDQLDRITKIVIEEAQNTRVAASFLPRVDVDPGTVSVPNLEYRYEAIPAPPGAQAAGAANARAIVNNTTDLYLTTFSANVYLDPADLWDSDLTAALAKFRRVANLVARAEDALVFSGQPRQNQLPPAMDPTFDGA